MLTTRQRNNNALYVYKDQEKKEMNDISNSREFSLH